MLCANLRNKPWIFRLIACFIKIYIFLAGMMTLMTTHIVMP